MAHQDDTPGATAPQDDWFTDPDIDTADVESAGRVPAEPLPRRLTVLADDNPAQAYTTEHAGYDRSDDWFAPDPHTPDPHTTGQQDITERAGYDRDQFDARTATLRGHPAPAASASGGASAGAAAAGGDRSWWRRHRAAVAVSVAVLVLGGAAVSGALAVTGALGNDRPPDSLTAPSATAPAPTEQARAEAAAVDFTWCAGQGPGQPVTEDSADAGAAAIWRFEKAFYYDRTGDAARAQVAPDAVLASARRLQDGIDQLEPDVEFCVLAEQVSPGVYDATVIERGPSLAGGRVTAQRFTTADVDGRTVITAITRR